MNNNYPVIKRGNISVPVGGVYEISHALNCTKQQIFALRKRDDFPRPLVELAATPVWDIDEVLAFKSTWVRRGAPKVAPEAIEVTG